MEKKTQKRARLSTDSNESTDERGPADVYTLKRLEASLSMLDIGVVANHIIAVTDALALAKVGNGQPILFRIVTAEDDTEETYAWWPLLKDESLKVLNTLYATLVYDAHASQRKLEHRTLVDAMVGLLSGQMDGMEQRNQAKALLASYFGTHELGSIKKVHFPFQGGSRQIGEIDVYLLPVKMATYTWIGI